MSAVRSKVQNLLVILFVVALASQQAPAQSYALTDLGTLGGNYSWATGINDLGQVCGSSSLPNTNDFVRHAFVWSGTMIDLGAFGWYDSHAEAINNLTQVVGKSDGEGFLWENGVMMDMDTPYGDSSSANDINIFAQITGSKNTRAYIWEDGDWDILEIWPACFWSKGYGINDSGQVAGAISCSQTSRAVLWDNDEAINLGVYPGDYHSSAFDINNQGQIVGVSSGVPVIHAVLWDGAEIIDLGVGGGSLSEALAINDAGQIVGWFGDGYESYTHRAFFWEDGVMADLSELIHEDTGWLLKEAYDINLSGQIVGWGLNPDGFGRGFLLTPCDFSAGPGEDCDGNGVPDECQSDCNGNGQPDVCDIADGISGDCDGDNVPDECDIGPPITQQPVSQEVNAGDFALFYVAAEGLQLAYQWRKDGIDLSDTERIFGTQGFTLIILDVQPGDAGEYDCVVTDLLDSSCSFSGPATLTVVVTCPPDFDCDGDVDAFDLAVLLGNWGPCPPEGACPADLDDDGAVNAFDLAQLLGAWGS